MRLRGRDLLTSFAHPLSLPGGPLQRDFVASLRHPPSLPGGPMQAERPEATLRLISHRDFVASLRHPQPPAAGCADKTKREPASKLEVLFYFYLRWEGDSNPRYSYPYVSLANWWFQPLTHPTKQPVWNEQDCKDINNCGFRKIYCYCFAIFSRISVSACILRIL